MGGSCVAGTNAVPNPAPGVQAVVKALDDLGYRASLKIGNPRGDYFGYLAGSRESRTTAVHPTAMPHRVPDLTRREREELLALLGRGFPTRSSPSPRPPARSRPSCMSATRASSSTS